MRKAWLTVAMIAIPLLGCGPKQTSNTPADEPTSGTPSVTPQKTFRIAFSECNSAEPYRAVQNAIFKQNAARYGDEISLVIHDAQQDNAKQVAQIENIIQQGVDLLIVAPNEAGAAEPQDFSARR